MSDENGPDFFEFTGGLFNLVGGAIGGIFNVAKTAFVPLLVAGGGLLGLKLFSDSQKDKGTTPETTAEPVAQGSKTPQPSADMYAAPPPPTPTPTPAGATPKKPAVNGRE